MLLVTIFSFSLILFYFWIYFGLSGMITFPSIKKELLTGFDTFGALFPRGIYKADYSRLTSISDS